MFWKLTLRLTFAYLRGEKSVLKMDIKWPWLG